jgi:hypothetical protein
MTITVAINAMLESIFDITVVQMTDKNVKDDSFLFSFHWNQDQKENILGNFYSLCTLCRITSRRLAEIVGPLLWWAS